MWHETIEAHRRQVRDAILDTAVALVTAHGLRSVTMSQVAEETGIGRATLYKYYPGVEAILIDWHERQIAYHLDHVAAVRDRGGGLGERLRAVLETYALARHESRAHYNSELGAFLHRNEQVTQAQQRVHHLIKDLLAEGIPAGEVRDDVAAEELANYCVHALAGASSLSSKAAVRRLVMITMAGLRPRA